MIIRHCLKMLQTSIQFFSSIFPHTSTRLAHWNLLLSHRNAELLDPLTIITAILPTCIYNIEFAARHAYVDNDDDEEPIETRPGAFGTIGDCIKYWFFVYKALDTVAGLELVLKASGFRNKILLVADLFMEGTMVLVAKGFFFLAVGIFVGAALEGFPFVKYLVKGFLIFLRLIVLDLREAMVERNGIPAGNPIQDE